MDNLGGSLRPDETRIKEWQALATLLTACATFLSAYTGYVALFYHMLSGR